MNPDEFLSENRDAYAGIFAQQFGVLFDEHGYGLEPSSPVKGLTAACQMPGRGKDSRGWIGEVHGQGMLMRSRLLEQAWFLCALVLAVAPPAFSADAKPSASVKGEAAPGRLVVCIASKCEYDHGKPADVEGPSGLAALAHQYGFPVTYYMKPFTVEACRPLLKSWHDQFGDEVGWFSDGTSFSKAAEELTRMRRLADWQPITAAGNLHYGADWSNFYVQEGIESVWGRCYEQSYTDGITDRGCPPGFYYALPACFRSPNQGTGGLISVPWLSNDLNLVFRTAQQSTFTFDPNDTQSIHVTTPGDDSFWKAELDQYEKQTRYNKIVPLVIQQETGEFHFQGESPYYVKWRTDGRGILEDLFKVLKDRHILVVNVSQAVRLYKQAYPDATPPTYNLFDNISSLPVILKCPAFEMSTERLPAEKKMAEFNGFRPCADENGKLLYFSPDKKTYYERGRLLTYFDPSGLLAFEQDNPTPIRITSYLDDPARFMKGILPELSCFFDTDKYIPRAEVHASEKNGRLHVTVKAELGGLPKELGDRLPYGVMLWGDYSAWQIPAEAPAGTKVLDKDGLFVPMVLKPGANALDLTLPAAEGRNTVEGARTESVPTSAPAEQAARPVAGGEKSLALTNVFFPFDSGVGRGKWTPQEQAQCVKDLGFDGIGYNYDEKKPELLDQWLAELHQRGLKLVDIYSGLTFPKKPGARPNDFLRDPIRKLKGTETVLWVPVWGRPHDEPFDDEAVAMIGEVADWCQESGIKLCLYAHGGAYTNTADDCLRLAKKVNRPDVVGVSINLLHERSGGNTDRLTQLPAEMGRYLFMVSINGSDPAKGGVQPLGKGGFDVYPFLKALRDAGYKGPIGIQCINRPGDMRQNLVNDVAQWKAWNARLASDPPATASEGSRAPGAESTASIDVDAARVESRVSRYLSGACLEDINHEIYPGLYSQMLFGESFQEPPPARQLKGLKVIDPDYGAWYVDADGALAMDELSEPSNVLREGPASVSGATGVEMRILPESKETAGLLVRVTDPGRRNQDLNAYFIAVSPKGELSLRGFGSDRMSVPIPARAPADRWFSLEARWTAESLEVFLDGKSVLPFKPKASRLSAGSEFVGLRDAFCRVRFRNWWVEENNRHVPIAFATDDDAVAWATRGLSSTWRGVHSGSAQGHFGVVSDDPFAGRRSQRITFDAGEGTFGVENRGLHHQGLCFRAGKPYDGWVWVRGDHPASIVVAAQSADGSKTYASRALAWDTPAATADHGWRRLDFTFTPSAEDVAGRFCLSLDRPGTVDLGRVFLQPGEWGRYKGLPVRKDLADKLVEEGVTVIRYGGSFADSAPNRWKRQIGPADRRTGYDGTAWQWYPYTTQGWGVIDFLNFCEAAGILPIPDLNRGETPQDVADFVEYVNGSPDTPWGAKRVADGHPKPYGLRHIEFGNEQVIDDRYYSRFAPVAEAVWAKDPHMILVVGDMAFLHAFTDPQHTSNVGAKTLDAYEKILALAAKHGAEVWFDEHIGTGRWPSPGDKEHPGDLPGLRSLQEQLAKLSHGARFQVAVFEFNADVHDLGRALVQRLGDQRLRAPGAARRVLGQLL